jgi:hypothetical protein
MARRVVKQVNKLKTEKMKKLGIMIFALAIAITGRVKAQQPQPGHRTQNYFYQNVIPFIAQQQAKFVQSLTSSEKAELQKIRKEMADFRKQGVQMRKAMQGHFNQQAWEARKARFEAIVAKARKIAEAHPQAAAAYQSAVEKKLEQWREQRGGNRMSGMQAAGGHGMTGKNPQARLEKLSDPALGLLFDAGAMKKLINHRMYAMKGKPQMRGMRPPFPENFTGRRQMMSHEISKAMHNPQVRKQIEAYKEKNILPVIVKQRKAFDQVLTKKEKKEIADARIQMKAIREKMTQARKEGVRMSDSTRLALQQQLEENRVAIRQIMLKHYSALQKALAPVKEEMPRWRTDIRKIVADYIVGQYMKQFARRPEATGAFLKQKGDFMFLLMDPQHPQDNELFRFGGPAKK